MGKIIDKNDFWFIENNPITKVGVYPYLGKQISQDCEPDKIYYVLRPKEELFRKETLDSLRLIPLIDGHTMIGKDFTAPEDKGLDGTLGDNVSHDTDTIYNDLKIFSNKMKEEIKSGKKELSLGYFCRYDKQPGTYKGQRYDYVQRDISANHLALVEKGRMGADVRVYDSKNIPEGEAFAMDSIAVDFNDNHDEKGRFAKKENNNTQGTENKELEEARKTANFWADNMERYGRINQSEHTAFRKFINNVYAPIIQEGRTQHFRSYEEFYNDIEKEWKKYKKNINPYSQDADEDIEWITVRGTHIPIKKGESKEQAVKNFLEGKKQSSGNNETKTHKSGLSSQKVARFRELLNKKDTKTIEKEFGKKIWSENAIEQLKSSLSLKYDKGSKDPNLPDFEYLKEDNEQSESKAEHKIGDKIRFRDRWGDTIEGEIEDINTPNKDNPYDYKLAVKNQETGSTGMEWIKKEQLVKESGGEKSEPEQAGKNKATDSMEYKTIQGEGKMADKKEKVAIDEDKRKLIDEIGGILKDAGLDDELIRTVIGKAEKIAYNKSEAGKGTDEGEEVEEVIEEKEEKAGKDCGKKAAKDKCGKDEEKDEETKKKELVKEFAKKEKLAKEVEDALGTFDHSEMTELEVAKYACDKLELGAVEGQELATLKGYLKGIAKAPKATFGYKRTVAADNGIQTEDAEFEKFANKGE